jgi:hypothetical protein
MEHRNRMLRETRFPFAGASGDALPYIDTNCRVSMAASAQAIDPGTSPTRRNRSTAVS